MTDPKPVPTDPAASEPAASAAEPAQLGAEYQFPTRKARRIAELTGMIPIIVPDKPLPGQPGKDAVKPAGDGGTAAVAPVPPVAVAPVAAVAAGEAKQAQATVELSPQAQAPQVKTDEKAAANKSSAPGDAAKLTAAAAREKAAEAEANSALVEGTESPSSVPAMSAPIAATAVTGLPLVPVPAGPIAGIPAAASESAKPPRTPKAGRDLPAAIGVGVSLLTVVLGSLLFFPLAFIVVACGFACIGVWEVNRAMGQRGIHAPMTPVMVGAIAMPASAYFGGPEGLMFALVASCGAVLLWRSLDSEPGAVKSIMAGVFMLLWIPFLLSFAALMMQAEQPPTLGLTTDLATINPGVVQIMLMLLLVVASDTFGYVVGVLFGKHPMAPKISPKKSWEGFSGSLGGAAIVGILGTVFLLDAPWWLGLVLAIGMVVAGTGGDFAESMVKRELGVKDMSNLLPGHGGVMDRLDSILFAAPVAYATFSILGRL